MIPLRDNVPSRRIPLVTYALIAANVAVFWVELGLGRDLDAFVRTYGLIPARFHAPDGFVEWWAPVFTSLFLHGGFLHLGGNMLYLFIFGDNVEDRLGHGRFLFFYLVAGAFAGVTQAVMFPMSTVPMVGASGAVAGVAGAYLVFFPYARVLTAVPIFFTISLIQVPAGLFLVFWFVLQFVYGTMSLGMHGADVGGVAWWAHVGGFLFGMVSARVFAPTRRSPRWTRR